MSVLGGRFRTGGRQPGRSRLKIYWWDISCLLAECWLRFWYRFRMVGRERVPSSGPVLFLSNHQSYYDPMINGSLVSERPFSPIASSHLFKFKPLAWLIRSYGAVPVSAGAGDKGAMKVALAELAAGRSVLIYPEGTRCPDGHVAAFQRGVSLMLRRAEATVVPMGIEGAFDVWPTGRTLPRLRGRIVGIIGTPKSSKALLEGGVDQALQELRAEIDELRLEARAMIEDRSRGRWPRSDAGAGPSPT